MFDCLEQLEPFAACFLQLRRTLVDLIPDRLSFIVDKNSIILLFCTQIPAVPINILLRSLKKLDNHVAVVHILHLFIIPLFRPFGCSFFVRDCPN